MAHPYSTVERVRRLLGPARAADLLDRDGDGAEDAGTAATGNVALVDDALERIANRVDGALGPRYVMPCAAITDTPATPGQVADLVDVGVAMLLYQWLEPKSDDYIEFRDLFQGEDGKQGLLGSYRDGTEVVIGLAEKTSDEGDASAAHESIGTYTAGGTDSTGDRKVAWATDRTTDQTRGI